MKTPAVIIASPAYRDWLRARAGEWLELTELSVEEAGQQPAVLASAALLLVQLEGPDMHEQARLIERLGERQPDLPIIALGNAQQPDAMLVAMRAGARDFLVPGRDDAGAVAQMERVLRRGAQRGPGRGGQVFAVISGHPHTGTAFLAEHLALAATEQLARNEPVLLLDLAQPAGAMSVFLNVHQEYSALNAIQDAYRCDQTLVDTAFGRHGSGLYVLGLPESQTGPAIVDASDLGSLLDVVRGLFGLTVVTADATLGLVNLRAVIEHSGRSLLLSDQSILNSRYNQALVRSLRQAGCTLEHLTLAVERYHRKLGLEPDKLAALLQLPLAATLTGDGLNRIQAMNAGESLYSFAPRDEYAQGVRRLAEQMLDRRAHSSVEKPRGLLGRLLD
jgi:pilus assembly protein CpaE